ncbi:hypothetical protein PPERSA_00704 [Pseudocohnilembus persalinus]|uniref:Uncharacterized protein n=1 Tax=Pseudocohnilembus persalinus TaxID=266149 RepID=A0A0V0QT95_PSEPJ|nr:hypothetical protein PPERSA_00704 [Pseudocohnilembus persalinus]|eukprot:KRX05403.1 hypothetical protein PPERSA_00704 [Pseudocohnilembus persalinus]
MQTKFNSSFTSNSQKLCNNCGEKNEVKNNFCFNCGNQIQHHTFQNKYPSNRKKNNSNQLKKINEDFNENDPLFQSDENQQYNYPQIEDYGDKIQDEKYQQSQQQLIQQNQNNENQQFMQDQNQEGKFIQDSYYMNKNQINENKILSWKQLKQSSDFNKMNKNNNNFNNFQNGKLKSIITEISEVSNESSTKNLERNFSFNNKNNNNNLQFSKSSSSYSNKNLENSGNNFYNEDNNKIDNINNNANRNENNFQNQEQQKQIFQQQDQSLISNQQKQLQNKKDQQQLPSFINKCCRCEKKSENSCYIGQNFYGFKISCGKRFCDEHFGNSKNSYELVRKGEILVLNKNNSHEENTDLDENFIYNNNNLNIKNQLQDQLVQKQGQDQYKDFNKNEQINSYIYQRESKLLINESRFNSICNECKKKYERKFLIFEISSVLLIVAIFIYLLFVI